MPEPTPNLEQEARNPLEGNAYRDDVEWLVENAKNFNNNQLAHNINEGLLESILKAAAAGEFQSVRTDPDTKEETVTTYSPDDIMKQLGLALDIQDTRPNDEAGWKSAATRSGGLRVAMGAVMGDKRLAEPFRLAVYKRQADRMKQKDTGVEAAGVSPEVSKLREEAVEDLGEEGVESAGILDPEVAASKKILNLELAEREVSPERKAEAEQHIQEEMAEVALDDAEIVDPEKAEVEPEAGIDKEQLEQHLISARLRYDNLTNLVRESVSMDMRKGAGRIDDAGSMINHAKNLTRSLDNERADLLRVVAGVENGSYGNESVQKLLENVSQTLHGTYARLRSAGENSIPDLRSAVAVLNESLGEAGFELSRSDDAFNQQSSELIQNNPDAGLVADTVSSEVERDVIKGAKEPIDAIVQATIGVDLEVAENAQTVRMVIDQIDEIKRLSYSGRVDTDTIRMLAARLASVAENTRKLDVFNGVLTDAVSAVQGSASRLRVE